MEMMRSARKGCTNRDLISGKQNNSLQIRHTETKFLPAHTPAGLFSRTIFPTRSQESQSADGFIGHDVVETCQLTKHLQAGLLLAASLGGQAVPLASVLLNLLNFDLAEVLQDRTHGVFGWVATAGGPETLKTSQATSISPLLSAGLPAISSLAGNSSPK